MLKLRYISAKSQAGDPWTQREPRLWGRSTSNHSEPRVWTKRSCQVKGLKNLAAKHEEHQHRTVGGETNKNREWSIDYGPNRRFSQQKMVICPTNMRKYCIESNFIYIYIYVWVRSHNEGWTRIREDSPISQGVGPPKMVRFNSDKTY